MALYGSDAAIKRLLRPDVGATFSTDEDARIVELRKMVSAVIEHETGAVFYTGAGLDVPPSVTRDADADGGSVLFLDMGLRSLSGVVGEATWTSGAWVNGVALTTSQYQLSGRNANGVYRTLRRVDGGWHGIHQLTGVWEDTYPTVPDDITYIANYMAAEIFKVEQAGPHGVLGPDGTATPIRDVLKDGKVWRVINHYRVGPGMWVVA